jgi:hypothetical protein
MSQRGRGRTIVVPALVVAAFSACTMNPAPEPAPKQRTIARAAQPDRVPGEYIVTLKAGSQDLRQDVSNAYSDFGVIHVMPIGNDRYVLKLERDPGPSVIEQRANRVPGVESVQPNFIYRTQ